MTAPDRWAVWEEPMPHHQFAPSNHVTARDGAMRPRRLAGPARVAPGGRFTIRAALADVAGLIGLIVAIAGAAILMAAVSAQPLWQ